jgi:hypothetical protein
MDEKKTMTIGLDSEVWAGIKDALQKAPRGMKKNETYLRILRKGLGIKVEPIK